MGKQNSSLITNGQSWADFIERRNTVHENQSVFGIRVLHIPVRFAFGEIRILKEWCDRASFRFNRLPVQVKKKSVAVIFILLNFLVAYLLASGLKVEHSAETLPSAPFGEIPVLFADSLFINPLNPILHEKTE